MRRGAPKIVFGAFCVKQVEPSGGGELRYLIIQGQAEGMEGSEERNCINVTTEHSFHKSTHTHTYIYKTHTLFPSSLTSWMSLSHFVPSSIQVPAGGNLAMLLQWSPRRRRKKGPPLRSSAFRQPRLQAFPPSPPRCPHALTHLSQCPVPRPASRCW